MKIYSRRDSATTVLRKLGIKPRDYDLFISRVEDGFQLDKEAAEKHVNSLAEPKSESPKRAPRTKRAPVMSAETCSGVARTMILAGATNKEVWEVIQPKFDLDDKKRSYPAWYRSDLRRRGELAEN